MIDVIDLVEEQIKLYKKNRTDERYYYFIKGIITALLLEYSITKEFYDEYLDRINKIAKFTPAD
jgi:hypothetical protein